MIAVLAAAIVTLGQAAAPAAAAPAAPSGPTVAPAVVTGTAPEKLGVKKNELVCESQPVLGTLFPQKICATREQIIERQRWDQKETRESTNLRPYRDPSGD